MLSAQKSNVKVYAHSPIRRSCFFKPILPASGVNVHHVCLGFNVTCNMQYCNFFKALFKGLV